MPRTARVPGGQWWTAKGCTSVCLGHMWTLHVALSLNGDQAPTSKGHVRVKRFPVEGPGHSWCGVCRGNSAEGTGKRPGFKPQLGPSLAVRPWATSRTSLSLCLHMEMMVVPPGP